MRYSAPQLLVKVEPSEAGQSSWAPGVAEASGAVGEEVAGVGVATEEADPEPRFAVGVQAHW